MCVHNRCSAMMTSLCVSNPPCQQPEGWAKSSNTQLVHQIESTCSSSELSSHSLGSHITQRVETAVGRFTPHSVG